MVHVISCREVPPLVISRHVAKYSARHSKPTRSVYRHHEIVYFHGASAFLVSPHQPPPPTFRLCLRSTMLGSITDKGPSLVVIRDTDGHVFGGYAPESWHCNGDFYGERILRAGLWRAGRRTCVQRCVRQSYRWVLERRG